MTQAATAERAAGPEIVAVECLGIAIPTGFALTPDGFDPHFAQFEPKKTTPLARHYADFLIAQDPTRFVIIETKKGEPETETAEQKKAREAEAKAAKKAEKEAAKAAKK